MKKSFFVTKDLTYVYLSSLANSEDPDEMLQNAAFHQGMHCLLR